MSEHLAIILGDDIDDSLKESLKKYGIDTSYVGELSNVDKEGAFKFFILKNYLYSLKDIKHQFPYIPLISLGPVANMEEFIYSNGKALINSQFFGLDLIDEFVGRFLNAQTSSLSLEFLFKDKIRELENIKITGHMSTGYYMDIISTDLFEKNYNVIAFREYFTALISYFAYLKKAGIAGFPFEVEYGEVQGSQFVLQCSVNISHFVTEYIVESFLPTTVEYPLRGLLGRCAALTDIFDISHIEKKSRIVFTAVWLNQSEFKSSSFNSFFLNRVQSFEYKKNKNYDLLKAPKAFRLEAQDELLKDLENRELPGFFMDLFVNKESLPSAQPTFLIRLVKFIQEEYEDNNDIKPLNAFETSDVKHYLEKYPDQEMIDRLKEDDYDFIVNCLGSIEELQNIEGVVEEVTTLVHSGDFDSDILEKLKVNVQNLVQEDITRIKGVFGEDQSSQVVKGEREEILDESQMVHGRTEEDNYKEVIKGDQTLEEEVWHLKKMQFSDEAMSILHSLDSDQLSEDSFKDSLLQLVQDKFSLSEKEALEFLEKLFGRSVDQVVNEEVVRRMQKELGVEESVEHIQLLKKIEEKNRINENLQQRLKLLTTELDTYKTLKVKSGDALQDKYLQLTRINEAKEKLIGSLKSQVEHLRSSVSNVDSRIAKQAEKTIETKDRIIGELQEKNRILQTELNEKPHHTEMENKVINALSDQKDVLIERARKAEESMQEVSVELKKSKFRIRQLEDKVAMMKKKMEQQLKNMSRTQGGGVGGTKESEFKIKQLEIRLEKLNELNDKNKQAMANAKRDAMQFKSENTLLVNQINELKRKLGVKK